VNPVLTGSPPYPFAYLDAKKDAARARGQTLHDFTIGDPLEPTPAFIREAMIAGIPSVSQYPTVAGRASLREAIAAYLQRRFGQSLDPAREIIPCSGAKEAVFHLPFALVNRDGDKRVIIWGEPGYPVYERGAAYSGADGFAAPLRADRGFLLEPEDIPSEVLARTCLFWVNYPHNPTGAAADLGYFERVMSAAKRYGFIVAADETYADIYYREPPRSLLEVAREGAVVIHSLSKRSGMTGYRSGFIAGDPEIIGALKKMRPSVGVASPVFVQAAAEAAWRDDAHVAERRHIFGQKREKVLALCRELRLHALDSGAGLYVWITVPSGETGASYAERLLEQGVVVTPGDAFGGPGESYARVALVPLLADFDVALDAWRRAHHAR
jgi:succinyldiaminopimelate transaminase